MNWYLIPLAILFVIIVVWFGGFFYANDFSVSSKTNLDNIHKVLVIFPHADDEVLTMGGFMSQLSKYGKTVDWAILTQGEKGNTTGIADPKLAAARVAEASAAAQIYGVKKLYQEDFPDGGITVPNIFTYLEYILTQEKPDLVLTYDLSGLYGHPDHIAVSQAVTQLIKRSFPHTQLWYASYPKRIYNTITLPEFMAKDPNFKNLRSYPNIRVGVGISGVLTKIKAVNIYKSQKQSFISGFPIKFIPWQFYVSLTPFEYFYQVK